jgi:hypothetical protein
MNAFLCQTGIQLDAGAPSLPSPSLRETQICGNTTLGNRNTQ